MNTIKAKLQAKLAKQQELTITPFKDGTLVQELANGWKKIRIEQTVVSRSNAGTAIIAQDQTRNAFINISPADHDLYGDMLEAGLNYNEILEALGFATQQVTWQLSFDKFFESQNPVMYKDKASGELMEADIDGAVYFRRGILSDVGSPNVWGTNEINDETGYPEFVAHSTEETEVEEIRTSGEVEAEVETGDLV